MVIDVTLVNWEREILIFALLTERSVSFPGNLNNNKKKELENRSNSTFVESRRKFGFMFWQFITRIQFLWPPLMHADCWFSQTITWPIQMSWKKMQTRLLEVLSFFRNSHPEIFHPLIRRLSIQNVKLISRRIFLSNRGHVGPKHPQPFFGGSRILGLARISWSTRIQFRKSSLGRENEMYCCD